MLDTLSVRVLDSFADKLVLCRSDSLTLQTWYSYVTCKSHPKSVKSSTRSGNFRESSYRIPLFCEADPFLHARVE